MGLNVLSLTVDSMDSAESQARQARYAALLNEMAPGSRLWVQTRSGAKAWSAGAQQRGGVDLVVSQTPFVDGLRAWAIKLRRRVPWIAQLHVGSLNNPYWLQESAANWLRRVLGTVLLRQADAVRVVSKSAEAWARGIGCKNVRVIPVGSALVDKGLLSQRGPGWAVMYVGTVSRAKGIFTWLQALQHSGYGYAVVLGDGPDKGEAEWTAQRLGLDHLTFVGECVPEQVALVYGHGGILVSASRHEAYGRVMAEGMAYGLPVVATDTEGARDLVSEATGIRVAVDGWLQMAEAIGYLVRSPMLREAMGQAGREVVAAGHRPDELARQQVQLWMETVRGEA